jgi:3-oxoacyl-[acyl-carrier-protein] synthase II
VTAAGHNAPATWAAIIAGRSGVSGPGAAPREPTSTRRTGVIKDFDGVCGLPDRRLGHYLSRASTFGVTASLEALRDAGVGTAYGPHERGIAVATREALLDLEALTDVLWSRHVSGGRELPHPSPLEVIVAHRNVGIAVIARLADCEGSMLSFHDCWTGSARAIGEAFRCIQDGDARLMLVGGYASISSLDLLGYALLNDTGTHNGTARTSRPHEKRRREIIPGEGAVVLVLEERDAALARGAEVYAEVAGHSSSAGLRRFSDSQPPYDGAAARVISDAVSESGLGRGEVDCMVVDGKCCSPDDGEDRVALTPFFGSEWPVMTSPTPVTGHMLCAAGALNVLVGALAIRDQMMPPHSNLEHSESEIAGPHRSMPVRAVVACVVGFDGSAVAIVLRRCVTSASKD